MALNHKHLMTLLQDNYTTIQVVFSEGDPFDLGNAPNPAGLGAPVQMPRNQPWSQEPGRAAPMPRTYTKPQKSYTYKALKTANVQANEYVVVDSPNVGLVLALVVGVDEEPQIDLDATFSYKWIVSKVDTAPYMDILEKERKFTQLVVEAERAKQKIELVQQFKDHLPPEGEARKLFDEAMGLFAKPALNNDAS